MKHPAGKFITAFLCMICMLSLSGCWNSRELNTLGIVVGVAIDKPEESGSMQITAQIVKPGQIGTSQKSQTSAGKMEAFWNVQDTGDTVFGTIRDLTNQSSRKLFFPHNEVLIFGESIAEEGIEKYVDFFSRDPETRYNVWILVSEGSAGEILDVTSGLEKIPADNIAKLVEGQAYATSQASAVRLRDFISRLMSKSSAPVATMIEVSGDGDEKVLKITGTAVFKKDKMVGKLDKAEGRGLLWVLGEAKSGIIEVEGPGGDLASMEIVRSGSKIEPEIRDGRVVIKVSVTEEGNLGDYAGTQELFNSSGVAFLEAKTSEAIRNEIMAAVEKAQELDADIFGFGDAVYQKYPDQWKDMADNWDEIFRNIEVEVSVEAKLRLMGRINNPIMSEQK